MKNLIKITLFLAVLFSLKSTCAQQVRFQLTGTNKTGTQKQIIPEGTPVVCKHHNGQKVRGEFSFLNEKELLIGGKSVQVSAIHYLKKYKAGHQAMGGTLGLLSLPALGMWMSQKDWAAPLGMILFLPLSALSTAFLTVDQRRNYNIEINVYRLDLDPSDLKVQH